MSKNISTNITASKKLSFFLDLARAQATITRAFDRSLSGLGFSYFSILYYLSQASEEKMRRIDLAEKVALTASGVTRVLIPMEKIGLVNREASEKDARVSFVKLASGGKRMLEEALEGAELLSEELLPKTDSSTHKEAEDFLSLLILNVHRTRL